MSGINNLTQQNLTTTTTSSVNDTIKNITIQSVHCDIPNKAPTVDDIVIDMLWNTQYQFQSTDVLSVYSDSEDNDPLLVKIVSAPLLGSLKYDDVAVVEGDAFSFSQIHLLTYTPPNGGYGLEYSTFKIAVNDSGIAPNPYSSPTNVVFNISANTRPNVQNSIIYILFDEPYVFSLLDVTNQYQDNNNDDPFKVKIIQLPTEGSLLFNGTQVTVGQEIDVVNIEQLTYVTTDVYTEDPYDTLLFSISDVGSQLFSDTRAIFVHVIDQQNEPPTANAGLDITLDYDQVTHQLDGSLSFDSDGTIVQYMWQQTQGSAVSIDNPTSATPQISGLSTGNYQFSLAVIDDDGAQDISFVSLTVQEEQPVAFSVEIAKGDCVNVPDFSNSQTVWMSALQSDIDSGNIAISDVTELFIDDTLTTLFDGQGDVYVYQGYPSHPTPTTTIVVGSAGNVSNSEVCPNILNITHEFDYFSGSSQQNQTTTTLDEAVLSQMYGGAQPFDSIRIVSLPNQGELGLQGNAIFVGDIITNAQITSGSLQFWAGDLDGSQDYGTFATSFGFVSIDDQGSDVESVSLALNANDISQLGREIEVGLGKCSTDIDSVQWQVMYIAQGTYLDIGTIVYVDQELTIPYDGGFRYHRIREEVSLQGTINPTYLTYGSSFRIRTNGVVFGAVQC